MLRLLALALSIHLLASLPALAVERVALVIGNGSYGKAALINPTNDARLMATTLEELGFAVTIQLDANQKAMKRAIQRFGARLDRAGKNGVGLFYYAGHGVQVRSGNYLVPIDAAITRESDVGIEAVAAEEILGVMDFASNQLNFLILDACRNNPYARGFRSAQDGLARMDAPTGSLVAYATAPGGVASDGEGKNSPFTAALTSAMQEPGIPVEQVFKKARIAVRQATNELQTPWESSSLTRMTSKASALPIELGLTLKIETGIKGFALFESSETNSRKPQPALSQAAIVRTIIA